MGRIDALTSHWRGRENAYAFVAPQFHVGLLDRKEYTMKRAIWISYDFGVRGDYEGIYTWLDDHGAIECGDSIAFLKY